MPGDLCIVCGNSRKKAPELSFHRFPTNPVKRSLWLQVFELVVKPYSTRVCFRHFMNGGPNNGPQANIGRQFASPIKKRSDRTTQAIERQRTKRIQEVKSILFTSSAEGSSLSSALSPLPTVIELPAESMTTDTEPMTASIGEQLLDNYQVIDLHY